eukprot:gene20813-26981_t
MSGYLGLREIGPYISLLRKARKDKPEYYPDVLMIDGNGILHGARAGVASHLGVIENIPTIGVSKTLLCIDGLNENDVKERFKTECIKKGDYITLIGKDDEILGVALKTTNDAINPRQVSSDNTETNDQKKPVLIFLPGLDGVGSYSFDTIQNLTSEYDLWRLEITSAQDRSSFTEISNFVYNNIKSLDLGPVILMGESFGGLLAFHLALRGKDLISKLVIINPATSYQQTPWQLTGPLIASTGPAFPLVSVATLLAVAVEPTQFQRIGQSIVDRINSTETAIIEIQNLIQAGYKILDTLPPDTLNHRLDKWLGLGSAILEGKFSEITVPTLILVGQNDRLLPSAAEGLRLKNLLKNTIVDLITVPDSGHALLDGSINLKEILRESVVFSGPKAPQYDIPYPSDDDIAKADKQFELIDKLVSPIFLSRDSKGFLQKGLKNVPLGKSGRPVLLVGNHQLFGGDLYFLIRRFLNEKHCLVRGLAHPVIFLEENRGSKQNNDDSLKSRFTKFGAIEVSPVAYYELLKRNETILLYPGGVKEATHKKNEANLLFWPEKVDFIRMAVVMDAIIVPFASIGTADSVDIILDSDEMMKLPFIGQRLKLLQKNLPQARVGSNDSLLLPLARPKIPSRQYFLFQKPFDTRQISSSNKTLCKESYLYLKSQVQDGLNTLIQFREKDPYSDFFKRIIYESITNEQAPTNSLNNNIW